MFHVSKDEMKNIVFLKQIKAISISGIVCLFVSFFTKPVKPEYLKNFLRSKPTVSSMELMILEKGTRRHYISVAVTAWETCCITNLI